MRDEDKIFGLIAQAEDIQRHSITLQKAADEAIQGLPVAVREAVRTQVREIITEDAKNASEAILGAANEGKTTALVLRRTGLLQGAFLLAVALVVAGAGFFAGKLLLDSRIAELAELKAQITTEQGKLADLRGKTWSLELVNYGDGTRGIVLPKGVKVDRTGAMPDGRAAIVIKP